MPAWLDATTDFIGNVSRPFAIIATSASAAATPIVIVIRMDPAKIDLASAAILVGAIFTGVGVLYGAKAWETAQGAKVSGQVQMAQAQAPPP